MRIKNKRSMTEKEIMRALREHRQALRKYKVKRIGLFGSYVRGEERPGSDIDVIVEFSETKSLLELVRIERELSEALGIKVDLLTEKSISPYLIEGVKREMEVVLG